MRTAVYTRISLDSTGKELGVQRQLDGCLALASQLGWEVATRYDDNDLSAFNGKHRPGFEAMLKAMASREFDVLLCWHTDRLYRNMKDLERLIEVAVAADVEIKTVNGGDLDLSTATGKMLARILGSVATQESEHKGERQRIANAQRRASGVWIKGGLRPFGYTGTGEPLEPEASMLSKAATDVLSGTSLRSISTDWNRRGVTTSRGSQWTSLSLRRVLRNPIYAAHMVHQDKIIGPGHWQPIIDPEVHLGLVALLNDDSRRSTVSFEKRHMGSGTYICGICGKKLYAGYPHGPGARMTYICRPTSHIARIGAALDAYIEAVTLEYLSAQRIGSGLRITTPAVDLGALRTRRNALQARKAELSAMFTEGVLDGPAVRRDSAKLAQQIGGIDQVLAEAARVSPVVALLADDNQTLLEKWAAATPDIKGKVVSELADVVVMPGTRGSRAFDPGLVDIRWK